jgi:PAS domain S-box-containing protein
MDQQLVFLFGFPENESLNLKKMLTNYAVKEWNKLENIASFFNTTKFEHALLLINVSALEKYDLNNTNMVVKVLKHLPLKIVGFVENFSKPVDEKFENLFDEIVITPFETNLLLNKIELLFANFSQIELFKNVENVNQIFHILFAQAPLGVTISNSSSLDATKEVLEYINSKYEEMVGRTKEEILELNWTTYTHPEDLKHELMTHSRLQNGEIESYSLVKRYIKKDGSVSWAHLIVAVLDLKPHKYVCFAQDITAQKEAELSLKESERSKSSLLSHIPGMAYRCKFDPDWTMEYVSPGCEELTGYKPEDLIDNKTLSYNEIIATEYRDYIYSLWVEDVEKNIPFKYEYEIITADGLRKWVYESGQAVYAENREVLALEGIILDISDRKQIEDELSYFFQHDTWTGLYNRKYFEQKLKRDLLVFPNTKKAILALNLTPLNQLSIRYGFSYSQDILRRVVLFLQDLCLDNYQLYSIYENWLAIYVNGYESKEELEKLATNVLNSLTTILSAEGVGWGIGIIEIEQKQKVNIEKLIKNLLVTADKSLSTFSGDFEICYFDEKLINSLERENDVTTEIINFISNTDLKNIYLAYQPIINLTTDEVWAFEALARMKSKKYGLVGPAEFIQIAEKTKLIIPLGEKIVEMACLFLKELQDRNLPEALISINISLIQLMSKEFVFFLNKTITNCGVKPSSIILEITETAVAPNYTDINITLGKLKNFGYHIALDDFGTGYSSLSLERELNIDCIKIDKLFINRLEVLKEEEAITSDIILMAHKLGHCVVAEGVETEKQLKYLKNVGCEMAQGFFFSEAVNETKAIEMLLERNRTK